MENDINESKPKLTERPLLAIIGDTQRPFLSIHKNHNIRSQLVGQIAQLNPHMLIHLGDFVAVGDSKKDWRYLWEVFKPIKLKNIPIVPVIGNHDLYWSQSRAKEELAANFPELNLNSYYSKKIGSIAIIVLNSNDFSMSAIEWDSQVEWYKEMIGSFEKDDQINLIITACHHPPFTNSIVIQPNKRIKNDFVPIFQNSSKSKLFLSGHAHTYEHFVIEGSHFIVSGGGGGQRQPLLPPFMSRTKDIHPWELFRPFHFITIDEMATDYTLQVHGHDKTSNKLLIIDKFTLLH